MGLDVHRWLKYAKARIDTAVGQGNRSLDRLEAEREAELAEKPWLRSDGAAPTLDEARARIEWEAERQRRDAGDQPGTVADPPPDGSGGPSDGPGGSPPRSPEDAAADAEQETARLELEARADEAAARVERIRAELTDTPRHPRSPRPLTPGRSSGTAPTPTAAPGLRRRRRRR